MTQDAFIVAARGMFQPSPVDVGHVPNWLRRRILKKVRHSGTQGKCGQAVLHYALAATDAWDAFDHWGSIEDGDQFVSEPYSVNAAKLAAAIRFADLVGLSFWINAISWHFPGQAVRFCFELKQDSGPAVRPVLRPSINPLLK